MATTPELHEPQIAAARSLAWHQAGEPLLTLEAARTWLNEYGLVLFAPRGASLGPAPSLVEATLGEARPATSPAEADTARALAARLIAEGSALPLNLLGGPGELPDFLVSASAFPFVFTLRGDKGWKRAPETSGAVKVTPLGLRVYELLSEKGSLTVAELVAEAGREVNESAIARALSELWQMLRVLPVLQAGSGETRWELTTSRFLKAVKAGSNAGQPTALSALVSLYLAQVYVASEEDVAAFLSPLTARSRVRDVVHGLSAARQLTESVLDGKAVFFLPDALPDFAAFAEPAEDDASAEEAASEPGGAGETDANAEPGEESESGAPGERIRRFDGAEGTGTQDRNLRGKPVAREGFAARPRTPRDDRPQRTDAFTRPGNSDRPRREGFSAGRREGGAPDRRPYAPRTERPARGGFSGDRPARPFRPAGDRPSFNRPWDEDRAPRAPRTGGADRPARAGGFSRDDRRPPAGDRPFRPRPEGREDRPARPFRPRTEGGSGDRPFRPRSEGGSGDRPFRPRPEGGSGDRPFRPRKDFGGDRPFRPRNEGGNDRPYRPRPEGEGDRPSRPRKDFGSDRPFRPRPEGGGDRPFRPRPEGGAPREGGFRRGPGAPGGFGGSRPGGDRPKPYGARPSREGGEGDRRPARPSFGAPRGDRPPSRFGAPKGPRSGFGGSGGGKFGGGPRKPGGKFAGRGDRPARPAGGDRPARKPRPEDEA